MGVSITLIPLNESHFPLLEKWNFDEKVTRFFSERPMYDIDQQTKWFNKQLADPSKKKYIIKDNTTATLLGLVSLMKIDLINKNAEIGITIGEEDFQKKGFAKKAMEKLLDIAFNDMALKTIYLSAFENNTAALNLFDQLGFKKEGILKNRVFKKGNFISLVSMSISKI